MFDSILSIIIPLWLDHSAFVLNFSLHTSRAVFWMQENITDIFDPHARWTYNYKIAFSWEWGKLICNITKINENMDTVAPRHAHCKGAPADVQDGRESGLSMVRAFWGVCIIILAHFTWGDDPSTAETVSSIFGITSIFVLIFHSPFSRVEKSLPVRRSLTTHRRATSQL